MQVLVRPIHPTVEAALLDVEVLHHFPRLPALFTFPDFLKRLVVEVSNAEAFVQEMSGAYKHSPIGH